MVGFELANDGMHHDHQLENEATAGGMGRLHCE